MSTLATLAVVLTLSSEAYRAGLDAAEKQAAQSGNNIAGKLSSIGGGLVLGGIAAATGAITLLGKGLEECTTKAQEAQDIQAQLGAVLKSTGGAAGVTAGMVNGLADKYSMLTKFAADDTVAGENMLLTFTNIGKDVFPSATKAMLDLSQAMGQDLKSSAIQLGKALNDPEKGMTALQRVGVTFTAAQKDAVAEMMKTNNVAGAQAIILKELEKEFGGSAEAAGTTAAGKMAILNHVLEQTKENIGKSLLPVLSSLADKMSNWLNSVAVQEGIKKMADGISLFAQRVIDYIPTAIGIVQNMISFLETHKDLVIGIFAALGVAVAAFAISSAVSMAGVIASMAPAIAAMAAVGAAVAILYDAWTQDWGGIQEKTKQVWAFLEPILKSVQDFLKDKLVQGLDLLTGKTDKSADAVQKNASWWQWLQDIWNGVTGWIYKTFEPAFTVVKDWLEKWIPIAINTVGGWLSEHLMPALQAVGHLIGELFPVWLQGVGLIFTWLGDIVSRYVSWAFGNLMGVLQAISPWISDYLAFGLRNIETILKAVTDAVNWLADAFDRLMGKKLPNINKEMAPTAGNLRTDLSTALLMGGGGGSGGSVTVVYNDYGLVRSGNTAEIVDKLGPAFYQYLRSKGLI